MLVATPGQTTSYALHAKKPCHSASNSNAVNVSTSASSNTGSNGSISAKNAANLLGHKPTRHVLGNCVVAGSTGVISTKPPPPLKLATNNQSNTTTNNNHNNNNNSTTNTTTTNALMKTLSVRLNRGTEFLKETVQKALISKIPSHLSSVLSLYTVPPTTTHRFPEERLNASSADSLQTEMCHFKPIRTAPTTAWKSRSKSRGACLKIPKACLGRKLNLACDEDDADSKDMEGYMQFRPKPSSTLLTTIVTTPTHQSAFVCLVSQMKTTATVQSKQLNMELHKTKSNRGRTKSKSLVHLQKSSITVPLNELILRKRRNPFVHVTKLNLPTDVIVTKSKRSIRNSKPSTTAANNAKSKSRITLIASKSKSGNNSNSNEGNSQRATRKRKISCEIGDSASPAADRPKLRKSARLSKDCSEIIKFTGAKSIVSISKRQSHAQTKRSPDTFSPPLTRSRLKQMSSGNLKLNPALEYRNRIF